MPELPEVETVRRGVDRHLPGRRLDAVELRRADLRWPIPVDDVRALVGRRCVSTDRRSKYLLLRFDGPGAPVALIHLGMSGRLFLDVWSEGRWHAESPAWPAVAAEPLSVATADDDPDWQLHEHWRMRFGDRLLRYVDARRFGMLDTTTETGLAIHPLLADLGPEPFDPAFDGAWLHARSRGRKVATKVFVMTAAVVVGVGNIYASEACFRAGVRPGRAAGRLTRRECDALVAAIRDVLAAAIEAGGTTLRDYIGVDQGAGYFQRELFVYGRDGQPCKRCATPIRRRVLGQRSTFWCSNCQR